MLSYIITFYNILRINFINWLDLCGFVNDESIKWVYYTYLGRKYRYPVKKVGRGPSVSDLELEQYFSNNPQYLEELKGPLGDYHGQIELIKESCGLSLSDNKEPLPYDNMAQFLFESDKIKTELMCDQILDHSNYRKSIKLFVHTFSNMAERFNLLMDEDIQDRNYNSAENLKLVLNEESFSGSVKMINTVFISIFDELAKLEKIKMNNENFEFFDEFCKLLQLPLSVGEMLRQSFVGEGFDDKLFLHMVLEMIKKFNVDKGKRRKEGQDEEQEEGQDEEQEGKQDEEQEGKQEGEQEGKQEGEQKEGLFEEWMKDLIEE